MPEQVQFFKKCTERTNMYTLHPTSMVPVKGIRSIGTYKIAPKKNPTPAAPVVKRLYRDQVPAGMYESRITDIRLLSDANANQPLVYDVVHHLTGIGDVHIQYTTGYNPRYKNFEYALVRYGLWSVMSSLGLEEMIEVSYPEGEELGDIRWRDTLSNYLKYSAPPPANTQ